MNAYNLFKNIQGFEKFKETPGRIKKVQEGRQRFETAQEDSKGFKKSKKRFIMFKQVHEGSRRFKKVKKMYNKYPVNYLAGTL